MTIHKQTIQSFSIEIYIPVENITAQGFIEQMLRESGGVILGGGILPGYFLLAGLLPDLALVRKGLHQAAKEHGAILRTDCSPGDDPYPPAVQAHLDSVGDCEERWDA